MSVAPTAVPEPVTVVTPPAMPSVRERRKPVLEDEESEEDVEEEEESPVRRGRQSRTRSAPQQPEQVISGVPNELLLPGAVAMLAVVIVGVFTISRVSSR